MAYAKDIQMENNEKLLDFYKTQSPITDPGEYAGIYKDIPDDIEGIVKTVQGVVYHAGLLWCYGVTPAQQQFGTGETRKVKDILKNIVNMDGKPLSFERSKEKHFIGNCRTFAILTCSILRSKKIPARVRGGYALYTWGRGMYENHWICEYWNSQEQRWVMIDAQIDQKLKELMKIDFNTCDIPSGKFVTASEAWQKYRSGAVPLENFGLGGKEGWNAKGFQMLLPDVVCDFMALNKVEPFPWDLNTFWNKKEEFFNHEEWELIDTIADLSVHSQSEFESMRNMLQTNTLLKSQERFINK